jgi:signal peptidase I
MTETAKDITDPFALQADLPPNPEYGLNPAETDAAVSPPQESNQPSMAWMLLRELVETVVLSLIIFLLIRQVVQNYRIESHSMQPNFYEGQFILVNKLAYKLGTPARGEVVVFHNPNNTDEDYIKRVIGLPGDVVRVENQTIFINDQVLDQPYRPNPFPEGYTFGPVLVPANHIFVMGDNRPNSSDSRRPREQGGIGPIDESLIVGKAWLRVWPLDLFGFVNHYHLEPHAAASGANAVALAPACCEIPTK